MSFLKQNAFKIMISVLVLLPMAIYWQTGKFDFVWDDEPLYINKAHFPDKGITKESSSFWSPNGKEMYAPITFSVWSFLSQIGSTESTSKENKFDPKPFHLANVIIHLINGLLVFFILSRFLTNPWHAWFGAMFFALHPVQTEAVAWVSELRGLLSAMFGFLGILYFIKFRKPAIIIPKPKKKQKKAANVNPANPKVYLILTSMFFALSVLSKPSGVAFAAIIILLDKFYFRTKIKDIIIPASMFLIIALPLSIIANTQESKFGVDFAAALWQKPFIWFDSIIFYMKNIILPLDLAAGYGRSPQMVVSSPWFYISALCVIALVTVLYLTRKKSKMFAVSFMIFVAGYLPVSGLITFNYQYWSTVSDRYIYISMLGAGLAFGLILEKFKTEKAGLVFGAVISLILSVITLGQVPVWSNELSLWNHSIEKYPDKSAQSYNARGYIYLEEKKYREALNDFNKSISIYDKEGLTFYNRGNVYFDLSDYDKAISDFSQAIKLRSNYADAYVNRGMVFDATGKLNEAINDFTKAISLQPKQSENYVNRGVIYAKLGNLTKAAEDFKIALKINPNDTQALEYLKQITGK